MKEIIVSDSNILWVCLQTARVRCVHYIAYKMNIPTARIAIKITKIYKKSPRKKISIETEIARKFRMGQKEDYTHARPWRSGLLIEYCRKLDIGNEKRHDGCI